MSKPASHRRERVVLEPLPTLFDQDSDPDYSSDPESAVSVTDDDGEDKLYAVDAIKWAEYKDSRRLQVGGFLGWHYGVMGYLKTTSDTEESFDAFTEEDGTAPLVAEFWKAVGKTIPISRKEPGGKLGELHETPKDTLKIWFKNSEPRRSYEVYKRRRAKELAGLPLTKGDSDYYWRKRRLARKAAERASAGLGTSAGSAPKTKGTMDPPPKVPVKENGAHSPTTSSQSSRRPVASPASSFNSLFDQISTPSEAGPSQQSQPRHSKRRRIDVDSSDEEPMPLKLTAEARRKERERAASSGTGTSRDMAVAGEAEKERTAKLLSNMKISKRDVTAPDKAVPVVPGPIFGTPDPSIFGGAPTPTVRNEGREPLFDFTPESSPDAPLASKKSDRPSASADPIVTVKVERQTAAPDAATAVLPSAASTSPQEVVTLGDTAPTQTKPREASPTKRNSFDIDRNDIESIDMDIDSPPFPEVIVTSATPAKGSNAEQSSPPTATSPTIPATSANISSNATPLAPGSSSTRISQPVQAPAQPAEASATPVAPAKLPPSQRPKYVQPKKIKEITIPSDPARDRTARRLGLDGRPHAMDATSHQSPTTTARGIAARRLSDPHNTLPARPARPPAQRAPPAGPRSTLPNPSQQRRWGNPTRPPPPSNQRPGNLSPTSPYPGGPPPAVGQPTTSGQSYGGYGNRSPIDAYARPPPNTGFSVGRRSPAYGGRSPRATSMVSPQYGNRSPLLAQPMQTTPMVSPQHGNASPITGQPPDIWPQGWQQPEAAPAVYEVKRDPRRRQPANVTAPAAGPSNGSGGTSPAVAERVHSPAPIIGNLHARYTRVRRRDGNEHESRVVLDLLKGSRRQPNGGFLLSEVDKTCFEMLIGQGGVVTEWAQTSGPSDADERTAWLLHLSNMKKKGLMFFCLDEIPPPNDVLTSHDLLFIMLAEDADLSPELLSGWDLNNLNAIAVLIEVPYEANALPQLPNPVRPDFAFEDLQSLRVPPVHVPSALNVPDSYCFPQLAESKLRGRTMHILPKVANETAFHSDLVRQCKAIGVHAPQPGQDPEFVMVVDGMWTATVRTANFQRLIERRTKFYSLGPDLESPVASWTCQPIWQTGGLITFSPTLILRQPEKFLQIMASIRNTPNWAAYIAPTTVLWIEDSWEIAARCPDAAKVFAALVAELYFDHNVRRLSGHGSCLTVAAAPPQLQKREKCAEWLDWLRRIWQCNEWADLVKVCRKRHPGPRSPMSPSDNTQEELILGDIERYGLEDLAAMRVRPHIVPYRRYLYIGQMSLHAQEKAQYGATIEMVSADDFDAVLSGAVF